MISSHMNSVNYPGQVKSTYNRPGVDYMAIPSIPVRSEVTYLLQLEASYVESTRVTLRTLAHMICFPIPQPNYFGGTIEWAIFSDLLHFGTRLERMAIESPHSVTAKHVHCSNIGNRM